MPTGIVHFKQQKKSVSLVFYPRKKQVNIKFDIICLHTTFWFQVSSYGKQNAPFPVRQSGGRLRCLWRVTGRVEAGLFELPHEVAGMIGRFRHQEIHQEVDQKGLQGRSFPLRRKFWVADGKRRHPKDLFEQVISLALQQIFFLFSAVNLSCALAFVLEKLQNQVLCLEISALSWLNIAVVRSRSAGGVPTAAEWAEWAEHRKSRQRPERCPGFGWFGLKTWKDSKLGRCFFVVVEFLLLDFCHHFLGWYFDIFCLYPLNISHPLGRVAFGRPPAGPKRVPRYRRALEKPSDPMWVWHRSRVHFTWSPVMRTCQPIDQLTSMLFDHFTFWVDSETS